MEIKKGIFDFGGEVDIKVEHKTNSRVSIRKRGEYYELYRAYYKFASLEREEIIFKSKDLKEVVDFSNRMFGMNDKVI
jgi:hypothetical protein